jgi:hypothetical protein
MTFPTVFRVAGLAGLILAGAILGRVAAPALSWAASTPSKPATSGLTEHHMVVIKNTEHKVAELEKQVAALDRRLKESEGKVKTVTERFNNHRHPLVNHLHTANLQTLELLMQRKDGSQWVVLTKAGVNNGVAYHTEPPAE